MNPTAELTADSEATCPKGLSRDAAIPHSPIIRPRHWLGKGFWAVADQGLFAGTSFMVTLLVARWLSPEEFGAFAVAHTVFLLLSILYSALLSEPLLVFGSSHFANRFPAYLRSLTLAHGLFSILIALVMGLLGAATWVAGSTHLAHSCLSFSIAGGCILFLWLMRRACYARFVPQWAALASLLYLILVGLGLFLLNSRGSIGVSSVVWLMGFSSLACALGLSRVFKTTPSDESLSPMFRETIQRHWKYGRWAMVAQSVIFIPAQIYMLLLPTAYGLAEAGAFKAVMNCVTPLLSINAAVLTLAIPIFVRAQGTPGYRKVLLSLLGILGSIQLLAWVVLSLFCEPLFTLMYDGRYTEFSHLIYVVGAIPVLAGVTVVLRASLKARERLDYVLYSALLAGSISLLVGIPVMFLYGLTGIAFALVGFWMLSLVFTCLFAFKNQRRTEGDHRPLTAAQHVLS